ncbi:MAG: ankyrin repeat domain-containing protein [Verrucomicrobiaceae bacterium]
MDHGAHLHQQDQNGATPLHRAVRTRCAAAVKSLLQAGSDPTTFNRTGSTPFQLAVQNTGRGGSGEPVAIQAQREIIRTFLDIGVSPKLKNGEGKTVADFARSAWTGKLLKRQPTAQ